MIVNNACSQIISQALSVDKNSTAMSRESAIARDILDTMSSNESVWRKPFSMTLLERIIRPIRNLICSKAYCQYVDVKKNLSVIKKELEASSPLHVQLSGLEEQAKLKSIHDEAKGVLHLYLSTVKDAIDKNQNMNPQNRGELDKMIAEIDNTITAKPIDETLPKDVQHCFVAIRKELGVLKEKNPIISHSLERLQQIYEEAKKLPGYEASALQQELRSAFAVVEIKQQLAAFKQPVMLGQYSLEQVVLRGAQAKGHLTESSAYLALDNASKQTVSDMFDQELKAAIVDSYRDQLASFKGHVQAEIKTIVTGDSFDKLAAFAKLGNTIWMPIAKVAEELRGNDFAEAIGKEVRKDFEKVTTSLAQEFIGQMRPQTLVRQLEVSLNTLELKMINKSITADELALSEMRIQEFTEQLAVAKQCYETIKKQVGASDSPASKFFSATLEKLDEQTTALAKLLEDYKTKTAPRVQALLPTFLPQMKQAHDEAAAYIKEHTVSVGDNDYVDLTKVVTKTSWRPAFMAIAGNITGTKDLLSTSATVDTFATKAIGAAGTFTFYALLGMYMGQFNLAPALAYATGSVAISQILPEVQDRLLPKSAKNIRALTGMLVMGAYASLPSLAVWGAGLFARGAAANPSPILQQAQASNNKTITKIDSALNHTNQGLKKLDDAEVGITKIIESGEKGQVITPKDLLPVKQDIVEAKQEVVIAKQETEAAKQAAVETGRLLEQKLNPKRDLGRIFYDTIWGAGAVVGGAAVSMIDPVSGGALMGYGAGVARGQGYTGE